MPSQILGRGRIKMSFIFKNWKTSTTGIIGAIPQIATGIQTKNWSLVISGVATILMGLCAKDGDVTGVAN
jgi:hypothetical protein